MYKGKYMMKTYTVSLIRTYLVSIEAETEYQAKLYAEYYLGDCSDLSNEKERSEKKFSIKEVEMVWNEASEIIN